MQGELPRAEDLYCEAINVFPKAGPTDVALGLAFAALSIVSAPVASVRLILSHSLY